MFIRDPTSYISYVRLSKQNLLASENCPQVQQFAVEDARVHVRDTVLAVQTFCWHYGSLRILEYGKFIDTKNCGITKIADL